MTTSSTEQQALSAIIAAGGNEQTARFVLDVLRNAGIGLAAESSDELVVRWVNVLARAVPPEADTIIRTITTTLNGISSSTTHWLDGLRSPRAPG